MAAGDRYRDLKRQRGLIVYFADPENPDSGELLAIELRK
jgi:hypothetical protein